MAEGEVAGEEREAPARRDPRRAEWERVRAGGLRRYLWVHGVLGRGLPMALLTVVVLEAFQGRLGVGMLTSATFHERLALALVLFAAGGALAAYAHWRVLASRFEGEDASRSGPS